MVEPEVVVEEGQETGRDEDGVGELYVGELSQVQVVDIIGEEREERQLEGEAVEEVEEDQDR